MTNGPRTIEASISQSNIDAALGQLLHSLGYVNESEEVSDIQLIRTKVGTTIRFTVNKEVKTAETNVVILKNAKMAA